MSSDQEASSQPSSPAWPEPPWSGWIETTGDALLILEAAKRGIIPRVTRRLVDSERRMITSGSVFVFDEDESGIKRWTDGYYWSPSRILGNFLLYRETDKRGAGHRGARADSDPDEAAALDPQSLSRSKADHSGISIDKQRERMLMGSLTNSYKFKPNGLMKKTFSVTIAGVPQTTQHLISYYKIEDVESGRLRSPSSLPELAALDISPEYLDKTHFRNPPKVEIGVDGVPRYRGEADDIETSPLLTTPLSTGLPLLTAGRVPDKRPGQSRGGRYDPRATSPTAYKRPRRLTKGSEPDSTPTITAAEPVSPVASNSSATPQPAPPPPQAPTTAPPPPVLPPPSAYNNPNAPVSHPHPPPPHTQPPPAPYPPYGVHAFYTGYPPPPPGHMYAPPPPPLPAVPPYAAPLPPPGPGGTAATSQQQVASQGPGVGGSSSSSNNNNAGGGAGVAGGGGAGGSGGAGQQHYTYASYAPPPPPPPSATPAPATPAPQSQHAPAPQPPSTPAPQVHRINPSQAGSAAPPQPQAQPYYPYYHPPPPPPPLGVPHGHGHGPPPPPHGPPPVHGGPHHGQPPPHTMAAYPAAAAPPPPPPPGWPVYSGYPPQAHHPYAHAHAYPHAYAPHVQAQTSQVSHAHAQPKQEGSSGGGGGGEGGSS